MILKKDNPDFFDARLIAEENHDGVLFRLYDNRIFHVIVPPDTKLGTEIIQVGYDFLDKNGGGRFYNIFQFGSFSDVDPELREWAADTSGNHYTHCDAIVIGNSAQKIVANFYMTFNKPKMPTKTFLSLEKAIEWIGKIAKENSTKGN